jgi:hypothetical protein
MKINFDQQLILIRQNIYPLLRRWFGSYLQLGRYAYLCKQKDERHV